MDNQQKSPGNPVYQIATLSPDAMFFVDPGERIVTFANEVASNNFGIFTGDRLSKIASLFESVAQPDQQFVKNQYLELKSEPVKTNVEFRMIGELGEFIWLSCDVYMIEEHRMACVIARNITKAKKHESYLVEYGARKNTLLDTVMHQLNGSLNMINNLALRGRSLDVMKDQQAITEFSSLILGTAKHAIDIIDDLLKKEHTESPGIHVKFSRTDVVQICRYIFEELKRGEYDRKLVMEVESPSVLVMSDQMKLLQIINNFASNALKFTRNGDEIRFLIVENADSVVVSVSDTGVGIPEKLQPFIFEKHGPAGRTGLNGEKSVGLGLSICKNLTILMDGRIGFESEENVGSTFFVELPKH